MNKSSPENRGLIKKGIDFAKKFDKALIVAGIGAAAIGATAAIPALVKYGTATAAGSVLGVKVSEEIEKVYDNWRDKTKTSLGGEH